MRDIVIYMNPRDFGHKTADCISAYWSMGRAPKFFSSDNKIWIAAKGCIQGYVECEFFDPEDLGGETLEWNGDTWVPLVQDIPCKPFRGFRYKWW